MQLYYYRHILIESSGLTDTIDESADAEETDEITEDNHHVDNDTYPEPQQYMYDENNPPTLDEYVDDTLYMNDITHLMTNHITITTHMMIRINTKHMNTHPDTIKH